MLKLFEKLKELDVVMTVKTEPGFGNVMVTFAKTTSAGKTYRRSVVLPDICLTRLEGDELSETIMNNLNSFYSEYLDFALGVRS